MVFKTTSLRSCSSIPDPLPPSDTNYHWSMCGSSTILDSGIVRFYWFWEGIEVDSDVDESPINPLDNTDLLCS
jgi:hypothetical protein